MALDIPTLRKLVALDVNDPLSRFALGKKLFELNTDLEEAAEHLRFANEKAPQHLATYHIYGQVLARLGRKDEAKRIFTEGLKQTAGIGEGMGRDLGPAMQQLLAEL